MIYSAIVLFRLVLFRRFTKQIRLVGSNNILIDSMSLNFTDFVVIQIEDILESNGCFHWRRITISYAEISIKFFLSVWWLIIKIANNRIKRLILIRCIKSIKGLRFWRPKLVRHSGFQLFQKDLKLRMTQRRVNIEVFFRSTKDSDPKHRPDKGGTLQQTPFPRFGPTSTRI